MGDTDAHDAADDQTGTAEMAALAVPAAVLFVLLAYPPVGSVRGVLGKRGVPCPCCSPHRSCGRRSSR